jgi:hypothetical protein
MAVEVPGTGEIAEPEIQDRTRSNQCDAANDWLCASCLNRVASEKDRCGYEGKSEFSFLNPDGIRFDIITFSRTIGCEQAGLPTEAHTWFPGHAWSYCVCDHCHSHLGWHYSGPSDFAGLIRDRIVRAMLIRN